MDPHTSPRPRRLFAGLLAAVSPALLPPALPGQEGDYAPRIIRRTGEAAAAIGRFAKPADLEIELFAAEPDLANPVSFCIDTKGRIFVAESFRLHKGVTDNRMQRDWIDEELACRTVADRVGMYQRRFAKELSQWQSEHERVRLLEDTDGDGRADRSVVFADGFHDLADGIGAGLLAYEGRVWFTCIPKLWLLEDVDGDGRADRREAVHEGFGVHTSLLGHDLHGLRIGPDGRLYFSIGDRGFHVVTPERTLSMPDEGAVFRCNLDGTGLEVVHRGLRNPQELAFDRFGNLFTGDNNSDGGDKARWVYVVEGGDSGWHIGYQSLPDRGPWNREKLWHPHHRGQAAYLVPPIANLINGPSGLTFDPGVGLPPRYRDRFFLCEFRGSSAISGVVAVKLAPKGAGFELTDTEEFLWRILPTDVEFGYDGGLYVLDWVEGWNQPLRGRVYRVAPPGARNDPLVRESAALLRAGMRGHPETDLADRLDHADQRVRQAAQFELVRQGRVAALAAAARGPERRMARIHGIWGLGQLGRGGVPVAEHLLAIAADPDHEIRAQVAKVLGECRIAAARDVLVQRLADRSSRVRFFAAIALGSLGHDDNLAPLLELLRDNDDRDPYLRHAGIQGLAGVAEATLLDALDALDDRSPAVRRALVVVLRRRGSAAVRRFLDDPDPSVVLEAARAIHDLPIEAALPDLAALLPGATGAEPALLRRIIDANYRLGTQDCLDRLVRFATAGTGAPEMRAEALDALAGFATPGERDRVLNLWRPVRPRDRIEVAPALEPHLDRLLADPAEPVATGAVKLLRVVRPDGHRERLRALVATGDRGADLRVAALEALRGGADPELARSARLAAGSEPPALRKAGVRILALLDPAAAVPMLRSVIDGGGSLAERQGAIATLGEVGRDGDGEAADRELLALLERLQRGELPAELHLDLLEAAGTRGSALVRERLAAYREARDAAAAGDLVKQYPESLHGGDSDRGRDLFFERDDATSCKKCHSIGGQGGNAGPDLSEVGSRLTREQILTAMLVPGREIAKGFGTFGFTLHDGSVVAGMVLQETGTEVVVLDAAEKEIRVEKRRIAERSAPASSMPPMAGLLDRKELRDLVEYLHTRRPKEPAGHGGEPAADRRPDGPWRAWLDCPGGELPFGLRFRKEAAALGAVIENGAERIEVPVVRFADGSLTLDIDYYDSRIVATLDPTGDRLDGTWSKTRGGGRAVQMGFHASRGDHSRFAVREPAAAPADFAGRWRVQFAEDRHPAVGVFQVPAEGALHGTFLTTLGDYRYLAGNPDGDTLHLSCFDGAHAFLFRARLQADGTLRGDFWSSDTWHETWTARRDPAAKLPDAFKLTTGDTRELGRLRFPDLDGRPRALGEPAFAGKARILVVFGSWCPNCKDETRYLAELDRRYRERGLSIVGLAFEHSADHARNAALLRRYAAAQGIRFPILVAGLSDKAKASQALPILDRVRSYPTTLFLHRDGRVRAVHTGFSGPGTGAEHQSLRGRFEALIEELLGGR